MNEASMNTPLSGEKKSWMDVLKAPVSSMSPTSSATSFQTNGYEPSAPPAEVGEHASSFMQAFSEKFGDGREPNAYRADVGGYAPPDSGAYYVRESQSSMENVKIGTEDKSEQEIAEEYKSIEGKAGEESDSSVQKAFVAAKNFNMFSCVVDSCFTVANTLGLKNAASRLASVPTNTSPEVEKVQSETENYSTLLDDPELEIEPASQAVVATF